MISELEPMSRRPLAPDLWEQALINGRIVSPGSDQEALEYAEKWYARQGGQFDSAEPAPEPAAAPAEQVTEQVAEQVTEQAAEPAQEAEPASTSGIVGRRSRARQAKGRYQGDDPATPERDEAYVEG